MDTNGRQLKRQTTLQLQYVFQRQFMTYNINNEKLVYKTCPVVNVKSGLLTELLKAIKPIQNRISLTQKRRMNLE